MTVAVDLFAGARGWEARAQDFDVEFIGVEWMPEACATSRAAGLHTIQRDIATLDPETFRLVYGQPEGLVGSPPCPLFSSAGKGQGRVELLQRDLHEGMRDAASGAPREAIARRRRVLKRHLAERLRRDVMPTATRARRNTEAERLARELSLVWEPARWVATLRPRWVALEQVPPVLELWRTMARALEADGYRCWVGVLSAERYGVPQTRKRAFLLASLDGQPHPPEPTHQEFIAGQPAREAEPTLFGPGLLPWVSMAQALGWGMTARPSVVVGARKGDGGGAGIDTGSGSRRTVEAQRDAGDWEIKMPGAGDFGTRRPADEPAPTMAPGKGPNDVQWRLKNGTHDHATERIADEPAPAMHFGARLNTVEWEVTDTGNTRGGTRDEGRTRQGDEPAQAITTRADQLERRGVPSDVEREPEDFELVSNNQPNATVRGLDEPAPTIAAGHSTASRQIRPRGYDPRGQRDGRTGEPHRQRDVNEPAPTIAGESRNDSWTERERIMVNTGRDWKEGGTREDAQKFDAAEQPAPAIDTKGRWRVERERGGVEADGRVRDAEARDPDWPEHRPATNVQGDPRIAQPGHKRDEANPDSPGRMEGAVRVSIDEAAILQSFPAGWPWQGTRTRIFQQIGNAVPPLLGRRVLEAAIAPTRKAP